MVMHIFPNEDYKDTMYVYWIYYNKKKGIKTRTYSIENYSMV